MKTAKYHKRCFDQIEGIVTENKALTGEVDRLRLEAEKVTRERDTQKEQMIDLSWRLTDKDRERISKIVRWYSSFSRPFVPVEITVTTVGLEEELERVRKEMDQLDQECSCILESERKAGEELRMRNRELTSNTCVVV
jgi:hypothetical protein